MNNISYCLKFKCNNCPRRKECDSKQKNDELKDYKIKKEKR